jgi:hypothetical protein
MRFVNLQALTRIRIPFPQLLLRFERIWLEQPSGVQRLCRETHALTQLLAELEKATADVSLLHNFGLVAVCEHHERYSEVF